MITGFEVLQIIINSLTRLSEGPRSRVAALAKRAGRPQTEMYCLLLEEALRRFVRSRAPFREDAQFDLAARVSLVNDLIRELSADEGTFLEFERTFFARVLALGERPSSTLRPWFERTAGVFPSLAGVLADPGAGAVQRQAAARRVLWDAFQGRMERIVPFMTRRGYAPDVISALREVRTVLQRHPDQFTKDVPLRMEEALFSVFVTDAEFLNLVNFLNAKLRSKGFELKLTRLTDGTSADGDDGHDPLNIFRRAGDTWTIRFNGGEKFNLRHAKGLAYIHILLKRPRRQVQVFDLLDEAGERPSMPYPRAEHTSSLVEEGDLQIAHIGEGEKALDSRARRAYKQKINDLKSEIEEAERNNDTARAEGVRGELMAILEHLSQSLGVRGRARPLSDQGERVRKTVSNAIVRARSKIEEHDEELFRHLHNSLRLGRLLSYNPETPIDWDT